VSAEERRNVGSRLVDRLDQSSVGPPRASTDKSTGFTTGPD